MPPRPGVEPAGVHPPLVHSVATELSICAGLSSFCRQSRIVPTMSGAMQVSGSNRQTYATDTPSWSAGGVL